MDGIPDRYPYNNGMVAPPAIAIIIKAEPIFKYFPNPLTASGQMAGHIMELANPKAAIKSTDVYPLVDMAMEVNITPRMVKYLRAFCWEIYLGMAIIPKKYPTIIATSVNDEKNLASSMPNPSDFP